MDIFKAYLSVCWLKSKPLDLPRSISFFKQNLIFYFIVEFLIQTNIVDDPFESFLEICFETFLSLVFLAIALASSKSLFHFIPIACAMIFAENFISLLCVPVLIWLTATDNTQSYYVLGALAMWNFAIITHIIKQMLRINIAAAIALAMLYIICVYGGAFALAQVI
ncbi:MAG: hypothetical protein WC782_02065 [Methylococcaceae bacterium]|jgi:hypothetical protein